MATKDQNRFLTAAEAVKNNQNDSLRYTLHANDRTKTFEVLYARYYDPATNDKRGLHTVPGLLYTAEEVGLALATRDALNEAYANGLATAVAKAS